MLFGLFMIFIVMTQEKKKRKIVFRITDGQFRGLVKQLKKDEKTISEFLRECLREKLKFLRR
jgi:hypothetical protein